MIVIAIIGILAAALFPSMNTYINRSKDTSRLSQGRLIITGNESLRADIGRYANPASEANCWGWDTQIDGTFLPELKNYTKIPNVDGTNPHYTSGSISCGWIQYARYPVGDWGCPTDKGNYYLMIIQRVNSSVIWDNPGFSCPGRTWVETRGGLAPPIIYGQYEN